jgi:hypothetical protein
MKKSLYVFLAILLFASCKKSGSDEKTVSAQAGIYVKFSTESTIVSYTDNNPTIPDNVNAGVTYGPGQAGSYLFTAKLQNDRTYTQQQYTLANPASGFSTRIYTIRFYYASDVNRWLYTYTFTDSN